MKEYDNFSATFAKSRKNMHWPEIEYFMDWIKSNPDLNKPGLKILDVGCGSGRLFPYIAKTLNGFDYLGVDSSVGMIEEAISEHKDAKFRVLEMQNLDKLDTKFDIIFLIASFHHLENNIERSQVLSIIKNILKPDGVVLMTNWNLMSVNNMARYKEMYLGDGDFQIKIGKFKRYYHGFSTSELSELFKENSFSIIENSIFSSGNNLISIISPK